MRVTPVGATRRLLLLLYLSLSRGRVTLEWMGWRRMGPGRSGRRHTRVIEAATGKPPEHVRVMRRQNPHLIGVYTGHDSSFHAISQNIHSYRELMRNTCSSRTFSTSLARFAHASTRPRIHRPTSANSGEA